MRASDSGAGARHDGQAIGRGDAGVDQVVRAGGKVVKAVLRLGAPPGLPPAAAARAAASAACRRMHQIPWGVESLEPGPPPAAAELSLTGTSSLRLTACWWCD